MRRRKQPSSFLDQEFPPNYAERLPDCEDVPMKQISCDCGICTAAKEAVASASSYPMLRLLVNALQAHAVTLEDTRRGHDMLVKEYLSHCFYFDFSERPAESPKSGNA